MTVTPFGITISVNSLSSENTFVPIVVNPSLRFTVVNLLQFENAYAPIPVTVLGILIVRKPLPAKSPPWI